MNKSYFGNSNNKTHKGSWNLQGPLNPGIVSDRNHCQTCSPNERMCDQAVGIAGGTEKFLKA